MTHRSLKPIFALSFLLLVACFGPVLAAPEPQETPARFHVRDFGAEPSSDNVYSSLKAAVEAAQATGRSAEILFEPGAVYRIGLPVLYGRNPKGGDLAVAADSRPFHDIRIENNLFFDYGVPAIELSCARDVTISGNQVRCSDKAVRGRREYAAVVLQNCENIVIDGLDVQDRDPRQVAVVDIGADCAPQGISVTHTTADVAETCKAVLDRRAK